MNRQTKIFLCTANIYQNVKYEMRRNGVFRTVSGLINFTKVSIVCKNSEIQEFKSFFEFKNLIDYYSKIVRLIKSINL